MMKPADDERITIERDRWYCLEQMIKANTPGKADGELAAWIDGKLYIHYKGFRWRTSDASASGSTSTAPNGTTRSGTTTWRSRRVTSGR